MVGKYGNLRGYVLCGHFYQCMNATLVEIVIGIVWRIIIGNYCDVTVRILHTCGIILYLLHLGDNYGTYEKMMCNLPTQPITLITF